MAEQSMSFSSKSLQSLYLRADLPGPRAPQSLSLNADLHLVHTLFSLYPLAQASTSRTFLSTPESCIFILKNIDGKYLACHLTMDRRKILGYLRTQKLLRFMVANFRKALYTRPRRPDKTRMDSLLPSDYTV